MPDKIAFIFCENFVRDAQNALAVEGLEDAVVATFPARCGRPPLTADELTAILESMDDVAHVEVFGSCCLSSLTDFNTNNRSILIHRHSFCFELIADTALIEQYLARGAYLTTPGWLNRWPAAIERSGFDKETAREMYAETTSGIVLFDTGTNKQSAEHLELFADFVDKPFEILCIGLSVLRMRLAKSTLAWQLADQKKKYTSELRDIRKQSSTHAMAIDLLSNLTRIVDEAQAIEAMLDVYSMLFAPQRLYYLDFQKGKPNKLWTRPTLANMHKKEAITTYLAGFSQDVGYTESGNGFLLRIVQRGVFKGVIAIEEIALPEYLDQYLNLALSIANICELPIENARKYQKLIQTEEMLKKANADLRHLSTNDSLTGIANRRAYDNYIEKEWKRMLRNNTSLSLIVCDIDFFKLYNDLYGHKQGDICLHAVAQIIHNLTMRPGDFVGRYGGEEFVVVLPDTTLHGAIHVAENIRLEIAQCRIPHEHSVVAPYVTLSFGVSQTMMPKAKNMSPAKLFTTADSALYEAKQQGRNRVITQKVEGE